MVRLGRSRGRRAHLSCGSDRLVCRCDCADGLRLLVLSQIETASHHLMKAKILSIVLLLVLWATQQALACPFCYGAKDGKSTEHMAVAIWFLFGAVLSVMGGIGAFSYSIWRHGRMPTPPHQKLMEDLERDE